LTDHAVVGHDEWVAARTALLAREKEFTRLRDDVSRQRRELPWEAVEKEYVFEGPRGTETLRDLFDGRSQLIVYHFMFAPEDDAGCPHCSFWADSFDANVVHLAAHGTTLVAISRAPAAKLEAYRERMAWGFHWVSSGGNDFNSDFGVAFSPEQRESRIYNYGSQAPGLADREGVSVFFRDHEGTVFHTYSAYARGIDLLNSAYNYIDLTPEGRGEEGRQPQFWVRRHDEYGS
jgi:predicted dithiol-disulfide oxidoreductase (DUF899 family)